MWNGNRLEVIILAGLFVLAGHCMAVAADATVWSPLDSAAVIARSLTVDALSYPDADTVEVASHKWVSYDQNGLYEEYYESFSKVLTEKGRRDSRHVTSSFVIPYNTTEIILAEVIKSDGRAVAVDIGANSRIIVEQSQMAANIYNPDNRVLQLSIPELKVGDVVHFILYDRFTKARVPGTWSDYVTLEAEHPIVQAICTVVAPAGKPLVRMELKSPVVGSVTHEQRSVGDRLVYRWVARDVPQAFVEPDMPPLYTQAQRLLVSTVADWETISRWYWNLTEPHVTAFTPAMKDTVRGLIDGVDDPEERIRRIFTWVSQEVRYLGITVEDEAPGYEPHPARMTFERRAGVCRDKAALLAAMLRIAGFEAYPVLIMNGPRKDPEVPQPFFNHAITGIRMPDGSYLLMDSTDENTAELFPAYLNNQSYLVATREGESIHTSPVDPAESNMMRIRTDAILQDDGTLAGECSMRFGGINDNAYRGFFARIPAGERRAFFEKAINRSLPGAEITKLKISPENLLDTRVPLTASFAFETARMVIDGESLKMLPAVSLGESVGMLNYVIGKMGLNQRRYPLVTGYTCGLDETFAIDLNSGVGELVSVPQFEDIASPGILSQRKIDLDGRSLSCHRLFMLKQTEYSPEEYRQLRQVCADTEKNAMAVSLFSEEPPWYGTAEPDALVLDEDDVYDVVDANTWHEERHRRIKVLSYAGKKKHGDLLIDYNPVWDEVVIKDAHVLTRTGEKITVDENEINIMDAPWVGAAPRYPAGKIMVISFPGVDVGSVIDYTIGITRRNRPFFYINGDAVADQFAILSDRMFEGRALFGVSGVFAGTDPIFSKSLEIRLPRDVRINIDKANWDALAVQEESTVLDGGGQVYRFMARNIPPLPREELSAPPYGFAPAVFAAAGSWRTWAAELDAILAHNDNAQPAAEAIAADLVAGAADDMDVLRRIRDYVVQHIREVEIAVGALPFTAVSAADETIRNGYGSTVDRAVVMHSMLRAAGFAPEYVLASRVLAERNLTDSVRRVPCPDIMNKMLVRVRTNRGTYYLNDSDQYAPLGSVAHGGYQGLLIGGGRMTKIEAAAASMEDRVVIDVDITLDQAGDALLCFTEKYYGIPSADLNRRASEMTPENRDRYLQEKIAAVRQGGVLAGEYLADTTSYPATERYTVSVQGFAFSQDDYLYFDIPALVEGIAGVGGADRQTPLYRDFATRRQVNLRIRVPDGFTLESLPRKRVKSRFGTSFVEHMIDAEEDSASPAIVVRQHVSIEPLFVQPEDYGVLRDLQEMMSSPANRKLILRKIAD